VRGLPSQLQEDARRAFEDALRHPSKEEADYLYAAGQVFYVAELLNIDPALQHLQRRRFEKTVLFLDTNILLALVHPKDESHDAVHQMVSLCKAAGFQLVYAPRTAEEFDALITAADKEFRSTPTFNAETAASFAMAVSNPILRGWLESFSSHRASWTQYRAGIGAWRNRLEQIDVCVYSLADPPRNKNFQAIEQALGGERRSRNGELRDPKRPRAIEHDAQLIAGIEDLVAQDGSPADPFGPRYWLITHDRHLVDCARSSRGSSQQCVAMLADEWVQYISPFLSPNTSALDPAAAFAGLLSSRFMPSLGRRMSLAELQLFAEPEVAGLTVGLSQEEACRAISDAHLEAVTRGGSKQQTDERAIRRLADIAARKREQIQRQGRLVPASRLEDLRAQREQDAAQFATASDQQAEKMVELEAQLQEAEADRKTSLTFLLRSSKASLGERVNDLNGWLRAHPLRAMSYLLLLVAAAIILSLGVGSLLAKAAGILIIVLTIITADFDQVRRNLSRILGR
jgi:predicted nucleic acid-binding protein